MSSVAVSECSRPEENHRADRRRDSGERQSSFRPGAPPIDLGRAHQSVLPIAPRPEKDGARVALPVFKSAWSRASGTEGSTPSHPPAYPA